MDFYAIAFGVAFAAIAISKVLQQPVKTVEKTEEHSG